MIDVANEGRGESYFIKDKGDDLRASVIDALAKACQPSLIDCNFKFGKPGCAPLIEKRKIFRNELIKHCVIVSKDQLKQY